MNPGGNSDTVNDSSCIKARKIEKDEKSTRVCWIDFKQVMLYDIQISSDFREIEIDIDYFTIPNQSSIYFLLFFISLFFYINVENGLKLV